nr:MAG: endoglucanase [Pseudomonadota bacterium]
MGLACSSAESFGGPQGSGGSGADVGGQNGGTPSNAGGSTPSGGSTASGGSGGSTASGGTVGAGGAIGSSTNGGTGGVGTGGSAGSGGSSGGTPGLGGASGSPSTTGGAGGQAGAPSGGTAGDGAGGSSAGAGGTNGGGSGGPNGGMGGGGAPTAGGAGGTSGTSGGGGESGGSSGGPMGFDPCPTAEPCKILPLGDSITDGFNVPGGYRIELFAKAVADGKNITFVGGSMNGPNMVAGMPFPKAHEGHSGWTIEQIDNIVPSPALNPKPHIVLLHIGTNDMYRSPNGAPNRLAALIDQILAELPDALLVVSNIIPFPGNNAVSTYNAAIPPLIEERAKAGKHILFVDQFQGFPTSELADGVHPNEAGYKRMAGVWYEAIEPYLH